MDAVTRGEMSPYFLRQLDYYGVDPAALAAPLHTDLVLSGDPEQSDLAPHSIGPRQRAVFALSELTLGAGQGLHVSAVGEQCVVLVIASLSMAAGARVVVAANTEFVVDQLRAQSGCVVSLAASDGQPGLSGVQGSAGPNGGDGNTPGGPGVGGSAGSNGSPGQGSRDAQFYLGTLTGDTLFEVCAGKGGDGGAGGQGGQGGMGGIDAATRKMAAGGAGAAGGPGGQGGAGNNGGRMLVYIQSMAPGASFTTRTDPSAGGAAAPGGTAGIPGRGHPDGAFGQPGLPGNPGAAGAPGVVEVKVV